MSDSRALNLPRHTTVQNTDNGVPLTVDGRRIEFVRESWLVEDRWWTEQPVRRRYWELLSVDGHNLVVFRDLQSGQWFAQRC